MKLIPRFISNSIQNKLFASFMTVLLLLVAVVAVSFVVISSLGKASDKILKMNYNSIITSMRMMDDLESIQREYIISRSELQGFDSRRMLEAQKSFSQWLGRANDNITESGENRILANIDSLFANYSVAIQKGLRDPNAAAGLDESIETTRYLIRRECLKLLKVNQDAMFVRSHAAQSIAQKGTTTLVLVALFVFVLGVALSWGLSHRIVRPIYLLKDATHRLAKGDYSVELHRESEDELGILTQEFDLMAQKLREFNDLNIRKIVAEQQKIEAIFANIRDGIIFIAPDYTIQDANQPSLEAFKLKRKDVIGRHFLEIIKQDKLFADLKKCLETRQPILYEEQENLLILRKGTIQLYLEYTFSPVLSHQDELLGVLFLLRDITNLKELDRLKSEFVMLVSHELKTPLTGINMSIDLLKESLGDNPKEGDLQLITIAKEEINRLRLLVNDLLDLSKIEAGKIEMHFASIPPERIMMAVSQYFKNQVAEKHADFSYHCPEKISNIWCDEEKLMLVFSNLISNALKAIPAGGKISMNAEASGKYVLFSIIDNGPGIPLAYQNKIFDRFVQVEDQNSARGTGLGLTISREIVRAHGGSIWVESNPGSGSAFFFTIPGEPAPLNQIT